MATAFSRASINHLRPAASPAMRKGPGIRRIFEDAQQLLIIWQLPHDRRHAGPTPLNGQWDFFMMMPQQHLTQRSQALKLSKDSAHGGLNFSIGSHLDASVAAPDVADGHPAHNFSPEHFLPVRFLCPLTKNAQLKLAHGALEPQQ